MQAPVGISRVESCIRVLEAACQIPGLLRPATVGFLAVPHGQRPVHGRPQGGLEGNTYWKWRNTAPYPSLTRFITL